MPHQLRGDAPDVFEVRGEAYLDKAGFEKLNRERKAAGLPLFANPRNAAAGSLKHLDPKAVAQRPLGIVFYGTGAVEGVDVGLHSKIFKLFKKLGLPTHEDWWVADSIDEILKAIRDLDQIRHDFRVPNRRRSNQSGRARAAGTPRVHGEIAALGDCLQIRGGTRRDPFATTSSFRSDAPESSRPWRHWSLSW